MHKVFFLLLFWGVVFSVFGQQIFESGIIYGGVTGGGFSTNTGSGTVNTTVAIPPNSSIKKAYLLATRDGEAPDIEVILNGNNHTFSNQSVISNQFISSINTWTWSQSTIHAINITNNIDSSIVNYNLTIPPQFNITVNGFYSSFYIYIIYENPTLQKMAYCLMINEQDVSINETYHLTNLTPIDSTNPVGLGVYGVFFCDTIIDGSYITINNDTIGLVGGQESNTLHSCTGVYANFTYYNGSLFGLEDDTPDSLMNATDVLADIKSYVNNEATFLNVNSEMQTPGIQGGKLTNPIASIILSYTTPCDTFTTTITTNDTICLGESVQLQATGGINYSWFGAFGGLNDTSIANPIATPQQTTTYICTITNDSGCVKTEHVKVWVNPLPVPSQNIVANNICGSAVGSISVDSIQNNAAPYNYDLTNTQTLNTISQTTNYFTNLATGNYQLQITDVNNCTFTDTATITQSNNAFANFTATPNSGTAPLLVIFDNTSTGANNFEWFITSFPFGSAQGALADTIAQHTTLQTQHLFNQSGTYETCLIAYNNLPTCADTICKTILINESEDSLTLIIPNIFTPNQDRENDNFVIQLIGAKNLEKLNVQVFNRWGELLRNNEFSVMSDESTQNTTVVTQYTIWDGRTTAGKKVPDGTYFYVINYSLKDASTTLSEHRKKGSVTLLR